MKENNDLFNLMERDFDEIEDIVVDCGIRYGTVFYLCFGKKINQAKLYEQKYEIEFEIGADDWTINVDQKTACDSKMENNDNKLKIMQNSLLNRKLLSIVNSMTYSTVYMEKNSSIICSVLSSYSSGFLYNYKRIGKNGFITLDGDNIIFD